MSRATRVRVVAGLLGLAGIAVVLLLLVPGPVYEADDPDGGLRCYSVFELPRDGLLRDGAIGTDARANGTDEIDNTADAVVQNNYCERLRTHRLAVALLVAVPTAVLLSVAVSARPRGPAAH